MKLANATRLTQTLKIWPKSLNPGQYQTIIPVLRSCKQTSEISQIHGYVIRTGLDHDPFILSKLLVASSLLDVEYAASIFKQIHNPNLFMYNSILRGYSISDDPNQAFSVFNNLRAKDGILLDQFSFITTLKACSREFAIFNGQTIHGLALRSGHVFFINVKNTLLHFYSACRRIFYAHKLFDESPEVNDVVSWNSLMGGYLHVSKPDVVLALFREMCCSCLTASVTTFLTVLSAVGEAGDSLGGQSLHGHCLKVGFCFDSNLVSALIDMYAKTGNVSSGRRVFDEVVVKDVVLWNCMISKYAENCLLEESLALLRLMKVKQVKPNSATLVGLLSACAASGATSLGESIGSYVEEEGLPLDAVIGTALVDMYAKCGVLDKAIDIFERMESKDVKSWTAMIAGYGVHGWALDAIRVFYRMEEAGCRPNEVSFLAVLSACSHGGLVMEGMKCFERMGQEYGIMPKIEHYGSIIDLFGRAGLLEEAHNFIKRLPIKSDATAWRALLSACRVYGNVELGECVKSILVAFDNEQHPTDSILLSSTYAIAGRLPDQTRMQVLEKDMFKRAGIRPAGKEDKIMKQAGYSTIEMDCEGFEL
ncbi:pentatricopeptide repeat-containing protein At1g26900, mitochondrial [Herrania umbratica]|uniref:Pentatricopeptide repeat-containing protein At1g26900, mitochondrial n=1 Tax=Herrania umbratica TaxID=108875 RepID=A0A6J1BJV9_9ROSI|nr:pentatricopeptide repeat-containing protein At1g26900, mitochondrial [Herrania umbratica]